MKHLILISLLITIGYFPAVAQQDPPLKEKGLVEEGITFLPQRKGEVIREFSGDNNCHAARLFPLFAQCRELNTPQGFRFTARGDDRFLEMILEPYLIEDGVEITNELEEDDLVLTKGGSSLTIYFNDPSRLFHLPVAGDVYTEPTQTAHFNGFPVYYNGQSERTVIKHSSQPLWIPVTQQQYLEVLIAEEETRKGSQPAVSNDENLREIEQTYQLLLKTDKKAAAEFKASMEGHTAALKAEETPTDMLTMLRDELGRLTPNERKSPAYYSVGAMERYGNLSGLVPVGDKEWASALVRPNYNLVDKNNKSLQLMIIRWNLTTNNEDPSAPRLYPNKPAIGYALVDQQLWELYNNTEVWKQAGSHVR